MSCRQNDPLQTNARVTQLYLETLTVPTFVFVDEDSEEDVCTACNNLHDDENWVACDGCDAWYHFGCTSLEAMPGAKDQWLCEECRL